jgi:hypothetical protein
MATFVHLAPVTDLAHIRRVGIRRARRAFRDFPGGIFAVPLTPDYQQSHQWVRELRRGRGTVAAVYFRIRDEEPVSMGHYGQEHVRLSAAEAYASFHNSSNVQGWQVVIPRCIERRELHRIASVSQLIGWRYSPTAKGHRPCACNYCQRGEYGGRRIRQRLAKASG